LLARLRKSVAAKKRFIRLPKGQSLNVHQKKQVWGVIRDIDGKKRVTAVPFTRLKKLVQPSAVADQVLRELSTRGLLVKAADGGLTRQLLIKGFAAKERCRYVCITGLMPQAFG
jgi:hypothetical protein